MEVVIVLFVRKCWCKNKSPWKTIQSPNNHHVLWYLLCLIEFTQTEKLNIRFIRNNCRKPHNKTINVINIPIEHRKSVTRLSSLFHYSFVPDHKGKISECFNIILLFSKSFENKIYCRSIVNRKILILDAQVN